MMEKMDDEDSIVISDSKSECISLESERRIEELEREMEEKEKIAEVGTLSWIWNVIIRIRFQLVTISGIK